MEFRPIPCHESLRPFIRNYWQLTAQCTATGTQQIFSNGAASLQFYLSQSVRLTPPSSEGAGEYLRYRTALLHQNMQNVGVVSEEGAFNIFGVEFVPFCSRIFFRSFPTTPSGSERIYASAKDLDDKEFLAVSEKIHAAETTEERVALLDDFLTQRLTDFFASKSPHRFELHEGQGINTECDVNINRLNGVFDEIVPTDGSTARPPHCQDEFTPADLASIACLSQKQFTRVFNKYVGMNPKSYLRLLRFHKALLKIQEQTADAKASLTDVALQCGYYDLAHMISDFRDICGYSPSELVASSAELTETFGQKYSGLMKKKIKIENLV